MANIFYALSHVPFTLMFTSKDIFYTLSHVPFILPLTSKDTFYTLSHVPFILTFTSKYTFYTLSHAPFILTFTSKDTFYTLSHVPFILTFTSEDTFYTLSHVSFNLTFNTKQSLVQATCKSHGKHVYPLSHVHVGSHRKRFESHIFRKLQEIFLLNSGSLNWTPLPSPCLSPLPARFESHNRQNCRKTIIHSLSHTTFERHRRHILSHIC